MKKNVHHLIWVFFFLLILGLIPISLQINQVFLAKSLGIIAVVSLSVALWIWKRQLTQQYGTNNRIKINLNEVFWLNQHIPFYASLSKSDKKVFENRLGLFLGSVNVRVSLSEKEIKEALLFMGSSAVQAFWEFPPISFFSIESIGVTHTEQVELVESKNHSSKHNIVFSLPRIKECLQNGHPVELWKSVIYLEKEFMLVHGQRPEESSFHSEVLQAWEN